MAEKCQTLPMVKRRWGRALAVLLATLLVGASCGENLTDAGVPPDTVASTAGSSSPPADGTATPDPPPTEEPDSSDAVASFRDVQGSVIRLEATGAFVDTAEGEVRGTWGGSGFFIGADGVAVTNNHVVTGSAILQAYVGGEDEPRNAVVLGVDECSDLAVIKVAGDGFTPLTLVTENPAVGTEIYSAGFPLGDPEYTLTTGIVTKARADGDTGWTSVEAVTEHSARINGGNSGGPLVDEQGDVVGINFAVNAESDQNFAITATDAQPLITTLAGGDDGHSIGVNGQALVLDEDVSGVFAQSVETGSAADLAGLEAGDFLLSLEGIPLATDATMATYCDVLRSNGADAPMRLSVFRPSTGELLEGTLNQVGEELEVVGGSGVAADDGDTTGSVVLDFDGFELRVPEQFATWDIARVAIDGETLILAVADDNNKRSTGLMGVPKLFELDGVVYVYPEPRSVEFWTLRALIEIDMAFFDGNGTLGVIHRATPPCQGDGAQCTRYRAANTQYVIHGAAGRFDAFDVGSVLDISPDS